MDIKISGDGYDNSYDQYLRTGQTRQENYCSDKVKTTLDSSDFSKTAVLYEKGGIYDFGTYSVDSVQAADSSVISKVRAYLNDLGFYDGEMGGGYTAELKNALKCFQNAYMGGQTYNVENRHFLKKEWDATNIRQRESWET